MKKIAILVPENVILGAVEGPHKLFNEVNSILEAKGEEAMFEVKLVGLERYLCRQTMGFSKYFRTPSHQR